MPAAAATVASLVSLALASPPAMAGHGASSGRTAARDHGPGRPVDQEARGPTTATALRGHRSRRIVRGSVRRGALPSRCPRPAVPGNERGQAARARSAALTAAPTGPTVAISVTGTPKKSVCATSP